MTPIILLDDLQKFIEENTKDILLEVKVRTGPATEKERAAKVYKMGLPEKDDNTQQIRRAGTYGTVKPYFADTGTLAEATHNRRAFLP